MGDPKKIEIECPTPVLREVVEKDFHAALEALLRLADGLEPLEAQSVFGGVVDSAMTVVRIRFNRKFRENREE
jgi:hypothetical protein